MYVLPNPQTIGDYLTALQSDGIKINRDYQRGGGIWPSSAKSALIETIITGYPMPALYLHQKFDRDTRKPYREVVDGQQRTDAIRAFYQNELRLSTVLPTERLRGKKFKQLEEGDFQSFVTYSLPIFLFTDATEADVREAFRRINSHTSVLNAEERRHSRFQGPMKWFVVGVAKELQSTFSTWGVFTKRGLNRMEDAGLVSEVVFALLNGLKTTKAEQLDAMFAAYDAEDSFGDGEEIRARIRGAVREMSKWSWLFDSTFARPHQLMPLMLAVIHSSGTVPALEVLAGGGAGLQPLGTIANRFGELAEALDVGEQLAATDVGDDQTEGSDPRLARHQAFVLASREKTNTGDTRIERFKTFHAALTASAW